MGEFDFSNLYSLDFSKSTGQGFNTFGTANMTYDANTGIFGSKDTLSGFDASAYAFTDASAYKIGSFDYGIFSGLDTSSGFDWASIINAGSKFITTAGNAATTAGSYLGPAFNALTTGLNTAAPYLGLATAITNAGAQKTAAIYQQGLYEVQAIDTLRLAQIRTDQDQKYATIQAGRKLLSAERQALGYTIQGNTLLRGMERSNAAVRARAAANGIVYNEGSAAGIQLANVEATYRDVGMSNLNALTARILGYEDAGAMILASKEQAELTMSAAEAQASQMRLAGKFAVESGGLLSNATLLQGGLNFAQTVKNPFTPG
jgi:hypothetical protein